MFNSISVVTGAGAKSGFNSGSLSSALILI